MVFSSLIFLFLYLAVTITLYYIVPFKFRNLVLLIVSLLFYGWGEPLYIIIMIYSIVVAYVFGFYIDKYRDTDEKKAKMFLVISLVLNLLALFVFKYTNFIFDNLRVIPLMSWLPDTNIKLPIGISFYTFQIMSYSIDLYRRQAKRAANIISFGTYVSLFPQLIAGPIVRYKDVDDQLRKRETNITKFASGVQTFSAGLFKKIIIADSMAAICEYMKNTAMYETTVVGAWMVVIFFTFQIYFDFSGYSDMAIGLGRMFGFEFLENFNYPYISKSITEFWRRWHMSLSTWFKEYVYIPLGGNRKGLLIQFRNIAIVWFITGFWHGASWNYILWGVYFGIILIIEKIFLLKFLEKIPKVFAHIYALFFIVMGWWIFYFRDLNKGVDFLKMMFGFSNSTFITGGILYDIIRFLPLVIIAIIGSTPFPKKQFKMLTEKYSVARYVVPVGVAVVLFVCTAYMVNSTFSPFLYYIF
ncbi:MAG: transcriptional regulator [Clostridiales bacterium GWF2_38_85]|nr:MAG: transcriptional regulator [Clostridiales bacterium GWF2_38_85]HBL83932.1 transcriptional regulator [Clostridiales bacterium]